MIAYKFLRPDGTSVFTQFRWPLPDGGAGRLGRLSRKLGLTRHRPGDWVGAGVDPCRSGIHACRPAHLPYWMGQVLYEVELDGQIIEDPTKAIASRGRLLRRVETWDGGLRDGYTRMCADRAHELAQSVSPPLEDWEEVVESSVPEGPALLGFHAARIAEEISGADGYHAERARQSAWLVERLDLDA